MPKSLAELKAEIRRLERKKVARKSGKSTSSGYKVSGPMYGTKSTHKPKTVTAPQGRTAAQNRKQQLQRAHQLWKKGDYKGAAAIRKRFSGRK